MKAVDKEKYYKHREEILDFLKKYEQKYRDIDLNISLYIETDFCLDLSTSEIPSFLSQILSKFNVYKEGQDEYKEIFNLLDKYSFLDGNCCEVGAGIYPRLAELTSSKIKLNNGSLTVYDPSTIFTNMENIKVIKEAFTKKTNIDKYDTIYGLHPCEASEIMIKKAFKEDKNLMIAFCDCSNHKSNHLRWNRKNWVEKICNYYIKKYGNEVEIINWPSSIDSKLPIMVRESSKYKEKIKKF